MLRRLLRSTVFGAAVTAAVTLPSTASAQDYIFSSCTTPGVCGGIEAFFTGTLLTVRLANADDIVGSALFTAQIIFSSALNAATPGAYQTGATATPFGNTTSIGTTAPSTWFFNGIGGSTELDLTAFGNVFIDGKAASAYRALPGDPDNGTWVTRPGGYVEFTSDLASVTGIDGKILGLGFCTDKDCASGAALVAVPEPATLTLFATGLVGMVLIRRRRKNA